MYSVNFAECELGRGSLQVRKIYFVQASTAEGQAQPAVRAGPVGGSLKVSDAERCTVTARIRATFQKPMLVTNADDVGVSHVVVQSVTCCVGCPRRFNSRTTSSGIRPSSDMFPRHCAPRRAIS
jgi:hypothetical protein